MNESDADHLLRSGVIANNSYVPSLDAIERTHAMWVKDFVRPAEFKSEFKSELKSELRYESIVKDNVDCNHNFEVETLRCHECMKLFRCNETMKCRLCKFEKKESLISHECVSTCGFGQKVEFIIERDGSYRPRSVFSISRDGDFCRQPIKIILPSIE
jgi:hypothetical protein